MEGKENYNAEDLPALGKGGETGLYSEATYLSSTQTNAVNKEPGWDKSNVSYKLIQIPNDDPNPSHIKVMNNVVHSNVKDEPPQSRIIVSTGEDSAEPMYVVMAPNAKAPQTDSGSISTPRMIHQLEGNSQHIAQATVTLPNRQTKTTKAGGPMKTPRDDHRRKQHNEVERRRRDKINAWIMRLAKIVPECNEDHTKQGQSKGGILHKTYDYIQLITKENEELLKKLNMSGFPNPLQSIEDSNVRLTTLEKENRILKTELRHAREDRDDIINQLKAQGIGLTMRPADDEYEEQSQGGAVMTDNGDGIVVIGQQ